jgi:hypothetical protein
MQVNGHCLNAPLAITVRLSGMVIDVNGLCAKEYHPTDFTPSGITTDVNPVT